MRGEDLYVFARTRCILRHGVRRYVPDWNLESRASNVVHVIHVHDRSSLLHMLCSLTQVLKKKYYGWIELTTKGGPILRFHSVGSHIPLSSWPSIPLQCCSVGTHPLYCQHSFLRKTWKLWYWGKNRQGIWGHFSAYSSWNRRIQKTENNEPVHLWEHSSDHFVDKDSSIHG